MLLESLRIIGKSISILAMIAIKAVFKSDLKMTKETIKAATPTATFNP